MLNSYSLDFGAQLNSLVWPAISWKGAVAYGVSWNSHGNFENSLLFGGVFFFNPVSTLGKSLVVPHTPIPFKFGGFFECNSIAPENQCLEDEISFWGQKAYFQVRIGC